MPLESVNTVSSGNYKKVESRLFKSIESTRNKENAKYVNQNSLKFMTNIEKKNTFTFKQPVPKKAF